MLYYCTLAYVPELRLGKYSQKACLTKKTIGGSPTRAIAAPSLRLLPPLCMITTEEQQQFEHRLVDPQVPITPATRIEYQYSCLEHATMLLIFTCMFRIVYRPTCSGSAAARPDQQYRLSASPVYHADVHTWSATRKHSASHTEHQTAVNNKVAPKRIRWNIRNTPFNMLTSALVTTRCKCYSHQGKYIEAHVEHLYKNEASYMIQKNIKAM